MSIAVAAPLILGLVLAAYLGIALTTWRRLRGPRVVICPETGCPAGVRVDLGHAIASAIRERMEIRMAECSAWPEREGCDHGCGPALRTAGDSTRTRAIAARGFEDRACAMCSRRIGPLTRGARQPGFMNPVTREVVPWDEVPAEELPGATARHRALCRDCTFAEASPPPAPERAATRRTRPHADNQPPR